MRLAKFFEGEQTTMRVSPGDTSRRHLRSRPARPAGLTVAAAIAIAVPALVAILPAQASGTGTSSSMTNAATAAGVNPASLGLTPIPGGGTAAKTVRLITGQQVQLTPTTGGKYTLTQDPASMPPANDGQQPAPLVIRAETKPGSSTTTLTATPTYALQLVASQKVDPHLFDITWLATHGYTSGTIPLVLHYTSSTSTTAVATAAAALPASTLVAGTATAHQATVNVDLDAAATFWSAITKTPAYNPVTPTGRTWYDNSSAPQVLAHGITKVTVAGAPPDPHPAAQVTEPAATLPTYQLTLRLHSSTSTDPNQPQLVTYLTSDLFGRAGGAIDQLIFPTTVGTVSCGSGCRTTTITFNVPAGSYQVGVEGEASHDFLIAQLNYIRPQFDLFANRTLDVWAENASFTSVNAPNPTESIPSSWQGVSQSTDGALFAQINGGTFSEGEEQYFLSDKNPQPVTAGTFSLETTQLEMQPSLLMSVAGPSHSGIDLSPSYPVGPDYGGPDPAFNQGRLTTIEFPDGTHTYPVVNVGEGTPADFAGQDVAGKLVIMQPEYPIAAFPTLCFLSPDALQNAISAGAAGVLVDMTERNPLDAAASCGPVTSSLSYNFSEVTGSFQTPAIPWVTLSPPQAQALESLVAQHPVSITVTAHSTPGYFYVVDTNYEGAMPTSVVRTVTAKDLATENLTLDSPKAGQAEAAEFEAAVFQPLFDLGITDFWQINEPLVPFHGQVYVSASPDTDVRFTATPFHAGAGNLDVFDPGLTQNIVAAQAAPTSVSYGVEPFTIGAQAVPPDLGALAYSTLVTCAMCRQGNDFVPVADEVSGAQPDGAVASGDLLSSAQLTSNAVALPRAASGFGWTLPPQSAEYQLTDQATNADLTWNFTSAAPTANNAPTGTTCFDALIGLFGTAPCATTPLVFVRYTAPVDTSNQVSSGTKQTLTIDAYHEGDGPAITSLTQQVSFDGGTTWTTANVSPTRTAGTYTATFTVPPLAQTNGFVSLRTTATDAGGNNTTQTYLDSYALK